MMEVISLSRHDNNVLEKIKDPESNPLAAVIIDPNLAKDPVVTDAAVYERVSRRERDIVQLIQQLEMQLAGLKPVASDPVNEYQVCVESLGSLISEYPKYASARNNRAQALRRLHGDTMLLQTTDPRALIREADDEKRRQAATIALADLDEAIKLLTPKSLFASISPQASRTLSMAHTQRAAIYHKTAKSLSTSHVSLDGSRKESGWSQIEFEEAASRDFAFGGRYGNEIAKGLAVSTNPTAKLCGQMVREALKKEYGPTYSA